MTISKEFTFEASHVLPKHPGKCSRLHGHSWKLKVFVEGPVDKETGFVMDYAVLKDVVTRHVIDRVDHQHLGVDDLQPGTDWSTAYKAVFGVEFYPSSENLVVAFARILSPIFTEYKVRLVKVELDETCTSKAIWRPDGTKDA